MGPIEVFNEGQKKKISADLEAGNPLVPSCRRPGKLKFFGFLGGNEMKEKKSRRRSRDRGRAFAAVAALQKFFSCRGHQYSAELIIKTEPTSKCDKKGMTWFILFNNKN